MSHLKLSKSEIPNQRAEHRNSAVAIVRDHPRYAAVEWSLTLGRMCEVGMDSMYETLGRVILKSIYGQ